jgi:alkaline phosphatase D
MALATLLAVAATGQCAEQPYKDFHRNLVTGLTKGNADAAIEACEAYLAQSPDDLESRYVLAAAWAQKGDIPMAMRYVEEAVAGGLPPGRFIVGPRDVLAPLHAGDAFKAWAAAHPVPLVHGPLVSASDAAARFWVRTTAEADVEIRVHAPEQPPGGPGFSARTRTSAAEDFSGVVEVGGLSPDTTYAYRVFVDGAEAPREGLSLRTFPPAGAKARFTVVFGGGAGYTPKHEHMWNTIRAAQPLALLMLGDNVYIDTPKVPAAQRYCYYRRQSRAEFRGLAAGTSVFAIYDDHDFFDNDCVPGPAIDDPPYKRDVWRVFRQNWANPSYGGGEAQPGCWFAFSIGDVDVFMMDCRFYRTRDSSPPTMLGPVQKAWLRRALAASRGTFRVLCSSVPWAYGVKPGSNDPWQGYKEEREELFDFLAKEKIGGVVLLSADRHRSDAWKIERPGAYPLYEFSSSRLTNIHTHGIMPGSLFGYNKTCSFGRLAFDTTVADPTVTYDIVTIDGETAHSLTLKRSQLGGAE